jgi:hypothetical protein
MGATCSDTTELLLKNVKGRRHLDLDLDGRHNKVDL